MGLYSQFIFTGTWNLIAFQIKMFLGVVIFQHTIIDIVILLIRKN